MKIYALDEVEWIIEVLEKVIPAFTDEAQEHLEMIMPSYTHLQRAKPITDDHSLMADVEMFYRDYGRITDTAKRIKEMSL